MKVYIDTATDIGTTWRSEESGGKKRKYTPPTKEERLREFLQAHHIKAHTISKTRCMVIVNSDKTLEKLHDIMGSDIYMVDVREEAEASRRRGYMTNGG